MVGFKMRPQEILAYHFDETIIRDALVPCMVLGLGQALSTAGGMDTRVQLVDNFRRARGRCCCSRSNRSNRVS